MDIYTFPKANHLISIHKQGNRNGLGHLRHPVHQLKWLLRQNHRIHCNNRFMIADVGLLKCYHSCCGKATLSTCIVASATTFWALTTVNWDVSLTSEQISAILVISHKSVNYYIKNLLHCLKLRIVLNKFLLFLCCLYEIIHVFK